MSKTPDKKHEDAKEQLSDEELDPVSGGFNPQPEPPGDRTLSTSTPVLTPGAISTIINPNHNQTLRRVRAR